MSHLYLVRLILPACLATIPLHAVLQPPDHPLFQSDAVHEIHLEFSQPDFWEQLTENFEDNEDPPYIPAAFVWGGVQLDSIGVRFKGNSSYWGYYGLKKSFKLDLDEYVTGQELDGLDKLNLNNCFLDPSYAREKCAYELCAAAGLATVRTNYAALYINDQYWGLYLIVEQLDQEFIESRHGSSEEGNLWKGDPHGTLEFLGTNEPSYYPHYELHTNEESNDWSELVDFTAALNTTPTAALRDSLHNRVDISSALAMLAVDNLSANLDSYLGSGHNYYLYHRGLDDRFIFSTWDMNEAWGIFNMNLSLTQLKHLSPHWMPGGQPRPLAARPWQVDELDEAYLGHIRRLMAGPANPDLLLARMEDLQDLVRPWALADTQMMFSPAQFEAALDADQYAPMGPPPGRLIPGLRAFIQQRHSWLLTQLGTWTPPAGLVINELMADNNATLADEAGDFDDWIEIANVGPLAVALGGLGLTDHWEGAPDFVFPAMTLQPGERVLVWADEEPGEGPLHAPFKLDADGEDIHLTNDGMIVDQTSWVGLGGDATWGRWPDGTGAWGLLSEATPGGENLNPTGGANPVLFINEFLADNASGLQDEAGSHEDWLELYNPAPTAVELGGLFLSDDLGQPTEWMLPDTTLAAGGFLVVWCDEDPGDGPLHANFKLGAGGEEIGLFGRLAAGNILLDSCVFGPQQEDVSLGRLPDGASSWASFTQPSPGHANVSPVTDLRISYSAASGRLSLAWSAAAGQPIGYVVHGAASPFPPFPMGWTRLAEDLQEPTWSTTATAGVQCFRVTTLYD